jgi:amidase
MLPFSHKFFTLTVYTQLMKGNQVSWLSSNLTKKISIVCIISFTSFTGMAQSIADMPAHELAEKIASAEITSQSAVTAYLKRIDELDRKGPRIQSIISINPNALALAIERDQEVQQGKIRGVLHGVPVLVKDNVETSAMPTTAGSLALLENNTKRDAPIIARLKDAGAIILGKTNLSEWANFRDGDSVSGWSAVGGQTHNPHSLDRSPCGSSSGTGAAIAAQFAPLGIGTETNGSIVCPANMNGIVGVKPTVGLLSRTHIVPISVSQDTAGPMTRSVKDAALMLSVMAGSDPLDAATLEADNNKQNYVSILNQTLAGKKIGVFRAVQSSHPEIIEALDEVITILKSQGVEIVEITEYQRPEGYGPKSLAVLLSEFKHELNAYLANSAPEVKTRSLEQLIAFNDASPRELSIFGQSLFVDAEETQGYDEQYQENLAFIRKSTRDDGIDKLLSDNNIDAIMMPSQTPAFFIDPVFGDSFPGGFAGAGWMAAVAGYPQVTVPMGSMRGLPINVSFMAGQWDDAMLLNIAYQYEQVSQKIIKPEFAPSIRQHSAFKEAMTPLTGK